MPEHVRRQGPLLIVAGVDEAGRGPLAGPVVAAAVVLGPQRIDGLDDSKKLTPSRREGLDARIRERALAWAIGRAGPAEIDRLNILKATLVAMQRAVESLIQVPGEVLVDGIHVPELVMKATAVVRGDSLIPEIMAASILAKVSRDREMTILHERYPCYGFDRHKGYPTREHFAAIEAFGPCEIHRRSFAPVRRCLGTPR